MSLLMGARGVGALLGPLVGGYWAARKESRLRLGILVGFLANAVGYLCSHGPLSWAGDCGRGDLACGGSSSGSSPRPCCRPRRTIVSRPRILGRLRLLVWRCLPSPTWRVRWSTTAERQDRAVMSAWWHLVRPWRGFRAAAVEDSLRPHSLTTVTAEKPSSTVGARAWRPCARARLPERRERETRYARRQTSRGTSKKIAPRAAVDLAHPDIGPSFAKRQVGGVQVGHRPRQSETPPEKITQGGEDFAVDALVGHIVRQQTRTASEDSAFTPFAPDTLSCRAWQAHQHYDSRLLEGGVTAIGWRPQLYDLLPWSHEGHHSPLLGPPGSRSADRNTFLYTRQRDEAADPRGPRHPQRGLVLLLQGRFPQRETRRNRPLSLLRAHDVQRAKKYGPKQFDIQMEANGGNNTPIPRAT